MRARECVGAKEGIWGQSLRRDKEEKEDLTLKLIDKLHSLCYSLEFMNSATSPRVRGGYMAK